MWTKIRIKSVSQSVVFVLSNAIVYLCSPWKIMYLMKGNCFKYANVQSIA